jgi:hypothetical protein
MELSRSCSIGRRRCESCVPTGGHHISLQLLRNYSIRDSGMDVSSALSSINLIRADAPRLIGRQDTLANAFHSSAGPTSRSQNAMAIVHRFDGASIHRIHDSHTRSAIADQPASRPAAAGDILGSISKTNMHTAVAWYEASSPYTSSGANSDARVSTSGASQITSSAATGVRPSRSYGRRRDKIKKPARLVG